MRIRVHSHCSDFNFFTSHVDFNCTYSLLHNESDEEAAQLSSLMKLQIEPVEQSWLKDRFFGAIPTCGFRDESRKMLVVNHSLAASSPTFFRSSDVK